MFGSTGRRSGFGPSRPPRRSRCSRRRHLVDLGEARHRGARRHRGPSAEASTPPRAASRSRAGSRQEARVPGSPVKPSMRRGIGRVPTSDARGFFGVASAPLRACCFEGASSWSSPRGGSLTTPAILSSANVAPVASTGEVLGVRQVCSDFVVAAEASQWCLMTRPGSWLSPGTTSSSEPSGFPGEQASRDPSTSCRREEGSRGGAPGWWKAFRTVATPRPSRDGKGKRSRSTVG